MSLAVRLLPPVNNESYIMYRRLSAVISVGVSNHTSISSVALAASFAKSILMFGVLPAIPKPPVPPTTLDLQ